MIVVLCGAEGAKAQHEYAARTDIDELHAVGFYPTALGRGIVVHQRSEHEVAQDLRPDLVIGGTPLLWDTEFNLMTSVHEINTEARAMMADEVKKKRGRPRKVA